MESSDRRSSPVRFGSLVIDPSLNPAILDTGTWAPAAARSAVGAQSIDGLRRLGDAVRGRKALPSPGEITVYEGSVRHRLASVFVLAGLQDGQQILLEYRPDDRGPLLPGSLADVDLGHGSMLTVHTTDSATLHAYVREIAPEKGARALGDTPRLGVGVRMSRACWPAIFRSMTTGGFAANAIQNSVRELNFLSDLLACRAPDRNYYTGFGMIESGHTGSTFEGLWVAGTLEALRYPATVRFGADADHLQVKRGQDGVDRVRRYLESCRYYSFFTMDISDVLDYGALGEESDSAATERAIQLVADLGLYRQVLQYHRDPRGGGSETEVMTAGLVDRLVGKYWRAIRSLAECEEHLREIRGEEPYDLEVSIDEHPPEVAAFDCLTSPAELLFVANELQRQGMHCTHIAPNVGIEKGFDYRGADGAGGLEQRLRVLSNLAGDRGLLIDIHSADDLGQRSREAIRRATQGRVHYKVSPMPQILFAGVLEKWYPALFREWWDDAVAYAREEARAGSSFASECLKGVTKTPPSHSQAVFHHFAFRFVGRRDSHGQFLNRQKLYALSDHFYSDYQDQLSGWLTGLAQDLFGG